MVSPTSQYTGFCKQTTPINLLYDDIGLIVRDMARAWMTRSFKYMPEGDAIVSKERVQIWTLLNVWHLSRIWPQLGNSK